MHRFHRAVRKALILSPTASHPQDYGNRNRVYQTTSFLKQQGYEIHFVLYPVEPDWRKGVPKSARTMRAEWESFAIVPTTRPVQPPALGEYHLIDEWWDPSIEAYLKWLFEHEFFDVFVVNYAFLSKAFELAPKATAKILETHDKFSGRKELLTSLGAPLEAFYTTEDQETIALDRSDIVMAIKESEAQFYQGLTARPVISVPFWPNRPLEPPAQAANANGALRAGFVGALNVVNVANMARFLDSFQQHCASEPANLTLDVAGEVCSQLSATTSEIRLLGRVDDLDRFYDSLDVVVAPMMFSTGLKIKVAEALAHGKAVVATANGFDGFTPTDECHILESVDDVTQALILLSRDPDRLQQLRANSASAARLAREQSESAYAELMRCVARLSGMTVLVTNRNIRAQDDLHAVRLRQWAELCSQITPTVIIGIGDQGYPGGAEGLERLDIAEVADDDDVVANVHSLLRELEQSSAIVEVVLSVCGDRGDRLWDDLKERYQHVTLDMWQEPPARLSSSRSPSPISSDMWLTDADRSGSGTYLSATAFRELPMELRTWKGARARGVVLVRCGAGESDEAGIDLLLAASTDTVPVQAVTLSSSDDLEFNRNFLDDLVSCGKPQILMAVGDDHRGHAICQALGLLSTIPSIVVSSSRFPMIAKRNDGRIRLCCSYREIADHITNAEELSRASSQHHEGSGWMSYCRLLASRARKTAAGTDHASPLPLNEILLRGIPHSLARLVG